jgi:hypothetical protein
MLLAVLLVGAVLLTPGVAGATDPDDLPPAPLPNVPGDGGGEARSAGLEAAYQEAFDLLVADRPAEAAARLRDLIPRLHDRERRIAAEALLELAEARGGRLTLEAPGLLAAEREGRFAFVAWTTFASMATGLKLGFLLDLMDARSNVLLIMATTGTGLAASLLASRDAHVMPANASLYGTGLIAGSWTAWHIARIARLPTEPVAGIMILGSALGGTAGFLAGRSAPLSTGASSLIGSSFLWGSVLGVLLLPVLDPADDRVLHGIMLGGSLAGLAAGATAAYRVEISRSRVLLMDLGALVGGLALGGLGIAIFDDRPAAWVPRVVPSMAIGGILAGGSIALWLSRSFDVPGGGDLAGDHGALLGREGGRWSLGVPAPAVLPGPTNEAMPGLGLRLIAGEL